MVAVRVRFMKRTLTATISSYGAIVLSFLVLAIIFFMIAFLDGISFNNNVVRQYIFTLVTWFMISTNPFMAAVISEIILVDQQSLFFTSRALFGNGPSYLPSPWIIYVLLYLVLTVVMIILSILFVKRPDR